MTTTNTMSEKAIDKNIAELHATATMSAAERAGLKRRLRRMTAAEGRKLVASVREAQTEKAAKTRKRSRKN